MIPLPLLTETKCFSCDRIKVRCAAGAVYSEEVNAIGYGSHLFQNKPVTLHRL